MAKNNDGDHFAGRPDFTDEVGEAPLPCPVPTCIIEGLNDPDAMQEHLDNEHTLEERQQLIIQQLVRDEENFETGTVHGELLRFYNWLHTNTDTFDIVMMQDAIETARENSMRTAGFPEDERKEQINLFLSGK